MKIENIKHKVNYYSLLLIAFMLPLKKELIGPFILLFFISGTFNFKQNFNTKRTFLVLGLFIIYLIGLLYSKNTSEGLQSLETKLSLTIFPIAFFFSKINYKVVLPKVLKSFIEGCFVSLLLGLASSAIHYYFTNDVSEFFYGNLSYFSHASYFSMYLNFGIIILYYFSFLPNKNTYIKPFLSLSLITVFSLTIFLLASKTGVSAVIATHILALIYWMIKHKKIVQGSIALAVVISTFFIGYYKSTTIHDRLHEVVSSFTYTDTDTPSSSTQFRMEAWGTASSLIANKPLYGYGTGSNRDLLTQEYKKKQIESLAEKRLNCHNQYLETTLNSGFIGLIVLLVLLILPVIWSVKQNNYLTLFFLILCGYNFLTESMLETQSGVVFFAFFYVLLVHSSLSAKSISTND